MSVDGPDRLAVWGHRKRAYVVPEKKFVYISLAKNACTSLKWAVAELAGEDLSTFHNRLSSGVVPDDAVHVRGQWKKALMLGDVDPEVRRTIHPDNGWFVFAVVRDPRSRVFSAWENKFLMRNPKFLYLRDEPWYPELPQSNEDVVRSFATFVEAMLADPGHELHADSHFDQQVHLLSEHEIDYSRIYEISEMSTLVKDFETHLASVGHPTTLSLRHSNDTPLAANAAAFAGGIREQVERLYAKDFERFGDLWDFAKIERKGEWTSGQLDQVRMAAGMGERIGELRDRGLEQRDLVKDQRRRLRNQRERIEKQAERVESQRERIEKQRERIKELKREVRRARRAANSVGPAQRLKARLRRS